MGANLTLSAPQISFSDANNVTFGVVGQTVTGSASGAGGADGLNRLAAGTQTAGTLATVVISDSNGLSFGMSGSTRITGSMDAARSLVAGTRTATGSLWSLADGGGLSFGVQTNDSVVTASVGAGATATGNLGGLAAGTQTATSGTVVVSDSNGLSFGMSGSTRITGSMDAIRQLVAGTRTATGSQLSFSNAFGISFGVATNDSVITASHNALTAETQTFVGGVAAGSQTATSGTILWSDSNGLSFGMSGSTRITGSYSGPRGVSVAGGNSINSGTLQFASSAGNVTWGMSTDANGGTIPASAPAGGGGGAPNRNFHEIMDGELLTHACSITGASFSKRPILVPFWLDGSIELKTINFLASRPAGTSLNMTYGVGFYSQVNSTQISLHASTTHGLSLTTSAQFSGVRRYEWTGLSTVTLTEGRWVAALYFSGSNNSTAVANLVLYGGQTMPGVNGYVFPGTNSTGATSGTAHIVPFWGVYASTTAAFPANIERSQISGQGSNNVNADIYLVLREI